MPGFGALQPHVIDDDWHSIGDVWFAFVPERHWTLGPTADRQQPRHQIDRLQYSRRRTDGGRFGNYSIPGDIGVCRLLTIVAGGIAGCRKRRLVQADVLYRPAMTVRLVSTYPPGSN